MIVPQKIGNHVFPIQTTILFLYFRKLPAQVAMALV